ncbi:MAG: hypothetical protein ACRDV7_07045, partial [Acidimicrobiia bacterium]
MARAVDGGLRAPSALGYLARHEARRRLGSLLAIALLIAFVGGVAMTALAGAGRTGSTYVFGIPIGILIGTTGWLIVARRLGIADEVPLPWIAIVC